MINRYSIIFKGEIRANVFLFDVRKISEDLTHSSLMGTVIVNADLYPGCKVYVSIPIQMDEYSEEIAKECVSESKKIMETIRPEV